VIVETEAELLLKVLRIGTVYTNVYLRRLYNFCVDMNWLRGQLFPNGNGPLSAFRRRGPSPGRSTVGSSSEKRIASERPFISWRGTWDPPSQTSLTFKQGRRLAELRDQLLPHEDSLAERATAANSFRKRSGSDPLKASQDRPVVSLSG
jgi:hypothetical protein